MKFEVKAYRNVRMLVLPWDQYQKLVIPVSTEKEPKVDGEIKIGSLVFQLWNARTLWNSTLRCCKKSSVRPYHYGKELCQALSAYWFGEENEEENEPLPLTVEQQEHVDRENRRFFVLEIKEPLL